MIVIEYHMRFLTLERFVLGSFLSERERTMQFISSLRNRIISIVDTFWRATLVEAVMRALECENAQESHHQARVSPTDRIRDAGQMTKWRCTLSRVSRYRVSMINSELPDPCPIIYHRLLGETHVPTLSEQTWGVCLRITSVYFSYGEIGHPITAITTMPTTTVATIPTPTAPAVPITSTTVVQSTSTTTVGLACIAKVANPTHTIKPSIGAVG